MDEKQTFKIALTCLIFSSCSLEDKGIRIIRGHTIDKQGIAHGTAALHAERYCQQCHGIQLVGGSEAQASCYQCHGKQWIASEPQFVFADSNHTLDQGGFMHHSGISQVSSTCTTCHGTQLLGRGDDGPPSCFLCHEQNWNP
ncbi:MAG: hypothetical protein NTX25_11160 [Proteobacteria bacterium]|nr:hypothetical protein [Pseudomonadota bacterium]